MAASAKDIPKEQKALIFQGGGSLGAYEAGVYQALYDRLYRPNEAQSNFFDILAGTSIGAINAAILASHVVEKGTWTDSYKKLLDFWDHVSAESMVDNAYGFERWWDYWHNINPKVATGEAARRYYSTKNFQVSGVPNVFSPPTIVPDNRFFDPQNSRYLYDNSPLRRSLEKFAKFPIKTDIKKNQPRLLVTAVDVQLGVTVTFDSYSDNSEYTTYNRDSGSYETHRIEYPNGITPDHVMASASVPLHYDYAQLDGRKFWDGAILSNTPLRETISEHKKFWEGRIGADKLKEAIWNGGSEIPSMEVYIANLWPSQEKVVPADQDGIRNRKNDLTYHDKTKYDEKIATLVTDYIDLVRALIDASREKKLPKEMITRILNSSAKSKQRTGEPRKYEDLVVGRFEISNVVRIERKDDNAAISNNWFDHSRKTKDYLIRSGYDDTLQAITRIGPTPPGPTPP